MCDLNAVLQILEEKNHRLCRFEEVTQQMLTCPTHLLTQFAGRRQTLLEEIQQQEDRLQALCREQPDGQVVLEAAAAHGEVPPPTDPLSEIFAAALDNRAVLSRLPETENQAMQRIRLEQEQILKKIRSANRGPAAAAAKFYAGSAGGGASLGKA